MMQHIGITVILNKEILHFCIQCGLPESFAKVFSQATLMTLSPHVSWDPLLWLTQFTSANLLSLVNTSITVIRQADDLCLKFEQPSGLL